VPSLKHVEHKVAEKAEESHVDIHLKHVVAEKPEEVSELSISIYVVKTKQNNFYHL
jgi:hypothetical protein